MRSLHQIVRRVLLAEGSGNFSAVELKRHRKIALSLYMSKMIPKAYKPGDSIHKLIDFTSGAPRRSRELNSDQFDSVMGFYDMIVSKYGEPTSRQSIVKIRRDLDNARNTGHAFWPISVMDPGSSTYDEEVVPEDVYYKLLSDNTTTDSGGPADIDLREIEASYKRAVIAIKSILVSCERLELSSNAEIRSVAETVLDKVSSIVGYLKESDSSNDVPDDTAPLAPETISLYEALSNLDLDSEGNEEIEIAQDPNTSQDTTNAAEEEVSEDAEEEVSEDEIAVLLEIKDAVDDLDESIDVDSTLFNAGGVKELISDIRDIIEPWLDS